MWFEVITDFVVNLFPKIQETALIIMTWLTTPFLSLDTLGIIFYPYEIMFGTTLTLVITYGVVAWLLDIIPG